MTKSNEWEFQGHIVGWVNEFVKARSVGLDAATQEFRNADGKRSDLILWRDHQARDAALAAELKTPDTPLRDFERDAVRKAQRVGAPYAAVWNMRDIAIYRTPDAPRKDFLPSDFVAAHDSLKTIHSVDDWIAPDSKKKLENVARFLILTIFDLETKGAVSGRVIDATVFATALSGSIIRLRKQILTDLRKSRTSSKAFYKELRTWAKKQGLDEHVDDVEESLAAQLGYRLVGQILFYHALRRFEHTLPPLQLRNSKKQDLYTQIRAYWDAVRAFDYEALYEESPLEQIPLTTSTEREVRGLVADMSEYDWEDIPIDVLGSIFEKMIPPSERRILGQYYTPPRLVDLIICLAAQERDDAVLDPGVGTGTFLHRAYERLRAGSSLSHADILDRLWGFDISAFPAELAVINLYRLDLTAQSSFPRVAVRDFFDTEPGIELEFPPAKRNPGSTHKVRIPVQSFDSIVGNPPYVRSQQLDDLDAAYKQRLATLAAYAGITSGTKFDAYAYFIVHALKFLKNGGRLAFVVPGAWLNSEYGARLQKFLLDHFQPLLILMSEAEVFFPEQDVNTIVVVAEKLSSTDAQAPRGPIRFAALTSTLDGSLPDPESSTYWGEVEALAIALETDPEGVHPDFRVAVVDGQIERDALRHEPSVPRDWTRYLRLTPTYRKVFGT